MNESNTCGNLSRYELIHNLLTVLKSNEATVVLTEYLGLLSWHGNWYIHGMVVVVVVGGICAQRERFLLVKPGI